jgi:hypothetical protein
MKRKRASKWFSSLSAALPLLLLFPMAKGYATEKLQLRFSTMIPQNHLHAVLNQRFAEE